MNPLNVFPNARSRLFGEPEDSIGIIVTPAVAGLSGTITQAEDTSGLTSSEKAGFSSGNATGKLLPASAGTNEASVVVTTPANSAVIVSGFIYAENDGGNIETLNIRVLDGSTTLESASVSIAAFTTKGLAIVHVDASPLAGSRTYNVQAWSPGVGILLHASITVTHVQFTDTHAGFIDTVAIAGKQINAPDSHTTHELAVLPG